MKKNKPKQNAITKKKEATRQETLRKKQQAQTERSHRRKEEEATRNRFMGGFCEENTRDKKKAREQNASTNTKRTESHTFNWDSRKPQLKDCKPTCEGFHTKPLYGRFCDGKENEIKTKMEKEQTQTKRKHQSLQ